MNADRESNRLPLRAGAMLLMAVAVVCIFLGVYSATSGGGDEDSATQAASQSTQTSAVPTTEDDSAQQGSASSASSSASADPTGESEIGPMCVLNAGTVTGLAGDVADTMRAEGLEISEVGNLQTSSISENTIFYGEGQKSAAEKVAAIVPSEASVDPRPEAFTECSGEIAVVVIDR